MAEVKATPTIVHGAAPVEPMPITPERYLSTEWMARENDVLWPRMWLFACLESDVANVGDFCTFNLGANQSSSRVHKKEKLPLSTTHVSTVVHALPHKTVVVSTNSFARITAGRTSSMVAFKWFPTTTVFVAVSTAMNVQCNKSRSTRFLAWYGSAWTTTPPRCASSLV